MRRIAVLGVVLGACGARAPRLVPAPVATAPAPAPLRAPACPSVPVPLPAVSPALLPPATGAEVLAIDTMGPAATLVTIDRGSEDSVRLGDRGWLVDDDGRPVHGSEFVVSQVHEHKARGTIRLLRAGEVRRYPRAQLLPSN